MPERALFAYFETDFADLPTTDVPVGSKASCVDTDAEYTFLGGQWYEKNASQG